MLSRPSESEVVAEPVAEPVQPTPDVAAGSPATGPPAQVPWLKGWLDSVRELCLHIALVASVTTGHSGPRWPQWPQWPQWPRSLMQAATKNVRGSDARIAASVPCSANHPFLFEEQRMLHRRRVRRLRLRRKARDAISKGYVDGRLATALQQNPAAAPG